jgi:hypothetical protein
VNGGPLSGTPGATALLKGVERKKPMRSTTGRPTIFLKIMVLVSLLDVFAAWVVTRKLPSYRYLIIDEDQLVENLTAFFFFSAFVLAFVFFLKLWRIRRHAGLAAVSVVALVGFLDEISFGERLFDLSMPVVGGVKFDAVHDVIEIARENILFTPGLPIAAAILAALLVLWTSVKRLRKGWRNAAGTSLRLVTSPSTYFVLMFLFFLSAAILIDMDIVPTSHWYRRLLFSLEEVFEMNAAFDLFFFCFYLYETSIRDGAITAGKSGSKVQGLGDINGETAGISDP